MRNNVGLVLLGMLVLIAMCCVVIVRLAMVTGHFAALALGIAILNILFPTFAACRGKLNAWKLIFPLISSVLLAYTIVRATRENYQELAALTIVAVFVQIIAFTTPVIRARLRLRNPAYRARMERIIQRHRQQ